MKDKPTVCRVSHTITYLPPRRLAASSLPCLIATSRIRRSLARASLPPPHPTPAPPYVVSPPSLTLSPLQPPLGASGPPSQGPPAPPGISPGSTWR